MYAIVDNTCIPELELFCDYVKQGTRYVEDSAIGTCIKDINMMIIKLTDLADVRKEENEHWAIIKYGHIYIYLL